MSQPDIVNLILNLKLRRDLQGGQWTGRQLIKPQIYRSMRIRDSAVPVNPRPEAHPPMSLKRPTKSKKSKHLSLLELNDDILLIQVQWFEALELLSWGMTCKRLYQTINSKTLWIEVARRLEAASVRLPLHYGDTIDSCSILELTKATTRACRLRRNLSSREPRLYRTTCVPISLNPFKRQTIPNEAVDCVHILDGRWIFYRRPDHLCIRHVEATKLKEIFHVPLVGYAGWAFQVTQVARDVALVTTRHDVSEVWGLMEVTLGSDKRSKPKVRDIEVGSPYKISLLGSNIAFTSKNGVSKVCDVYADRQTIVDQPYSNQREYLHSNGHLFGIHFQPGGRLELTARRLDPTSRDKLLEPSQSVLNINLKQTYTFYPLDTYYAKASIRAVSDELLTIWHRVHMKVGTTVYYALFVIEVPYLLIETEGESEAVVWGEWTSRGSYVADGQQYVGLNGTSMLLARRVDEQAVLTVYPQFRLPSCGLGFKMTNRGISLPVPEEDAPGESVHAVRVGWDDAHGIAVIMLENGLLRVLHYA